MNCANHPETPVSAYCQHCGKPLCSQCVRPVQGVIYCEQCLAEKLSGSYSVKVGDGSKFAYTATGPLPPGGMPGSGPNPGFAAALGFIPGVGAMYNGQFVKALAHVIIFVILISLTDQNGIFGLFIAAWVFYQVFDAFQTAKARRDGMPLPDPFGLNELGHKLGIQPPHVPGAQAPGAPGAPGAYGPPAAGFVPPASAAYGAQVPPAAAYPPQYQAAYPVDPNAPPPPPFIPKRSEPVGAIILIALGVLFLFSTTGILGMFWIHRSWPLILIGLGIWLVYKRVYQSHDGGAQ